MGILATIFGWLGAGVFKVLGADVLQPILKTIQAKNDDNRSVAEASISAEVQANNARAIIAPSFKGLIYLTSLPAIAHWTAIIADSMPWLPGFGLHEVGSWKVGALPPAYQTIEGTILVAFFISSPLTTLAKAGAAALIKR